MSHSVLTTGSVTPQPPGRTPHSVSLRASGTTQPQAPLRCPGGETLLARGTPPEPPVGTLGASRLFDAHGMQPDVVLGVLDMLGARSVRILVVGCEPASVDYGMELSEPVANAVDEAVQVVLDLVAEIGRGRDHEPHAAAGIPGRSAADPQTTDKGVSHVPWHSR